jgi:hypothetical protein
MAQEALRGSGPAEPAQKREAPLGRVAASPLGTNDAPRAAFSATPAPAPAEPASLTESFKKMMAEKKAAGDTVAAGTPSAESHPPEEPQVELVRNLFSGAIVD